MVLTIINCWHGPLILDAHIIFICTVWSGSCICLVPFFYCMYTTLLILLLAVSNNADRTWRSPDLKGPDLTKSGGRTSRSPDFKGPVAGPHKVRSPDLTKSGRRTSKVRSSKVRTSKSKVQWPDFKVRTIRARARMVNKLIWLTVTWHCLKGPHKVRWPDYSRVNGQQIDLINTVPQRSAVAGPHCTVHMSLGAKRPSCCGFKHYINIIINMIITNRPARERNPTLLLAETCNATLKLTDFLAKFYTTLPDFNQTDEILLDVMLHASWTLKNDW